MNPASPNSPTQQLVQVCRCVRWQVYQRLQELSIPCTCLENGDLHVEVNTPTQAWLLRSVVQQITAPRQQLVEWLERCGAR